MGKRFDVTIPFKPGPWYSVEVDADNKVGAISKAIDQATMSGFKGKRGNAIAVEMK
jgi:hypothetical protein